MVTFCTQRGGSVDEAVARHYDAVRRFVRKRAGDTLADDITQEVFLTLLRIRDADEREITAPYLLTIAANLIKRHHARGRALRPLDQPDLVFETGAPAPDPESQRSIRRDLSRALADLPDPQSQALRLLVCDGLSYRAAAATLRVSVETVNNWRTRALLRLRRTLAPHAGPDRRLIA